MSTPVRVLICVLVGLFLDAVVAVAGLWLYLDILWARAIS